MAVLGGLLGEQVSFLHHLDDEFLVVQLPIYTHGVLVLGGVGWRGA